MRTVNFTWFNEVSQPHALLQIKILHQRELSRELEKDLPAMHLAYLDHFLAVDQKINPYEFSIVRDLLRRLSGITYTNTRSKCRLSSKKSNLSCFCKSYWQASGEALGMEVVFELFD